MTPLYVSAHLCGGGCHTASHSCLSTGQTTLHIPVLLSSCGLTSGMCSKTCSTVAIQEDTACRCGCAQEQETCTSDRQAFNTHSCMCECKEKEEYTMCRDKGRVWDYKECVCSCPLELVKPCSTGLLTFMKSHRFPSYSILFQASSLTTHLPAPVSQNLNMLETYQTV